MKWLVLPLVGAWGLAGVLAWLDGRRRWVAWGAVVGLVGVMAASAALLPPALTGRPLQLVTGGWRAGVGIRLRADLLSVLFCLVTQAVLGTALLCETLEGIHTRAFPALVLFLAAGLTGAFLTTDAFSFYVFFELSMGASFALASYGGGGSALRAAFTFVVVNLVGSVLFLSAVVMLYQTTGTLDMDGMARWAEQSSLPLRVPAALLLSAFGVKLGLFPFHAWVPPVYRGVRTPVAAMLAGALANVGSYGLLRLGSGALTRPLEEGGGLVLSVLGALSLLYGTVLALARQVPGEVLAYTAVAQAGYLLVALGLGGEEGWVAAVVLALAGALDKAVLFLALGLEGVGARVAFAAAAFSTVGVPLSAGFLAKASLLHAALARGRGGLVALVVLASALGLVALFRAFQRRYWREESTRQARLTPAGAVTLGLAAVVVVLGGWPEWALALGRQAVAAMLAGEGP